MEHGRIDPGDYPLLSRQPLELPQRRSEVDLIQEFLLQHGIQATEPIEPAAPAEPAPSRAAGGNGRLRRPASSRHGILPHRRPPTATDRMQALHAAAAQRARRAIARQWARHCRWALDHPDWPDFLATYEQAHQLAVDGVVRHNNAFRHWLLSPAGQKEVEEIRRHREIYRLQHAPVRPRRGWGQRPADMAVATALALVALLLLLAGRILLALLPLMLLPALLLWRRRRY
ncbi:MAG: hypothetical protein VKJ66_09090 [Synechococcus sp.]|nr:hypothetical protein [Synechococcus sp.]